MNWITRDIMRVLNLDEGAADKVRDEMDRTGIDYSECTAAEFNSTARRCHARVKEREATASAPPPVSVRSNLRGRP